MPGSRLDKSWIIDTLEPVMTAHRLIVNESVLRADVKTDDRAYQLMYQLTHITRDRGCLSHDDQLDALAGGVAHYMRSMRLDVNDAKLAQEAAEMEALIEAFDDALDGGPSLFSGRRLRLDDVGFDDWDVMVRRGR